VAALPSARLEYSPGAARFPESALTRPHRILIAVASTVVLAVFVAGCGGTTIDPVKVEDTLQASLEKSFHEKITSVDCPSGQDVTPGATFTCEVTFSDDKRKAALLKIRDKEADISVLGLEAIE
jgi:NAD(P)H-hydrate repair Nnr-like enzyme with NAD(P)H-hydrate epimerase domain